MVRRLPHVARCGKQGEQAGSRLRPILRISSIQRRGLGNPCRWVNPFYTLYNDNDKIWLLFDRINHRTQRFSNSNISKHKNGHMWRHLICDPERESSTDFNHFSSQRYYIRQGQRYSADSQSDEPEDFIFAPSKHACGTPKYDQAINTTSGEQQEIRFILFIFKPNTATRHQRADFPHQPGHPNHVSLQIANSQHAYAEQPQELEAHGIMVGRLRRGNSFNTLRMCKRHITSGITVRERESSL